MLLTPLVMLFMPAVMIVTMYLAPFTHSLQGQGVFWALLHPDHDLIRVDVPRELRAELTVGLAVRGDGVRGGLMHGLLRGYYLKSVNPRENPAKA